MESISLNDLTQACRPGGSGALTSTTPLRPAEGPHAAVAPAKFVSAARGGGSTFAFETRYHEGQPKHTVLIDSKQSQLNRIEETLENAVHDQHPILSRTPRIEATYGHEVVSDLRAPHRAFDGLIRAGTVDGRPITQSDAYRRARNASKTDARALLELSPGSLVFGSWDSTRATNQARFQSALTGEIIGILADQSGQVEATPPRRGGARVDPVGMSVQLSAEELGSLVDAQAESMSPKTVDKIRSDLKKAKDKKVSASMMGLGGVPPTLEALGGVACSRIIRSHVLSFAALRQLRFGAGPDGDTACRALLAAFALNGLARSDAELHLRANCAMVEDGLTTVLLDQRHGNTHELAPLTIDEADELLGAAIDQAVKTAGIRWDGQVLHVEGSELITGGAVEEDGA